MEIYMGESDKSIFYVLIVLSIFLGLAVFSQVDRLILFIILLGFVSIFVGVTFNGK